MEEMEFSKTYSEFKNCNIIQEVNILKNLTKGGSVNHRAVHYLSVKDESHEERADRYECIFSRQDIDGWDVRQAMNDLAAYDAVPEPRVIIAALHACRRLNDYALTVRFLESVRDKCGHDVDKIYPYILQEVGPTVAELGCDFPEALGYDKPELYCKSACDYD